VVCGQHPEPQSWVKLRGGRDGLHAGDDEAYGERKMAYIKPHETPAPDRA
jgi:hypothetical protein